MDQVGRIKARAIGMERGRYTKYSTETTLEEWHTLVRLRQFYLFSFMWERASNTSIAYG
jgi:hypothetical protein